MSNVRPTVHSGGRNFISRVIQQSDKEKETGVLSAPFQNPTLKSFNGIRRFSLHCVTN